MGSSACFVVLLRRRCSGGFFQEEEEGNQKEEVRTSTSSSCCRGRGGSGTLVASSHASCNHFGIHAFVLHGCRRPTDDICSPNDHFLCCPNDHCICCPNVSRGRPSDDICSPNVSRGRPSDDICSPSDHGICPANIHPAVDPHTRRSSADAGQNSLQCIGNKLTFVCVGHTCAIH